MDLVFALFPIKAGPSLLVAALRTYKLLALIILAYHPLNRPRPYAQGH